MGGASLTALALALGAFACLGPTQITVVISTDVPCGVVARQGVAIHGGVAKDAPLAVTFACSEGPAPHLVGTLVVAPSGAKDEEVTLSVVGGVGERAEACTGPSYAGCIVARRRLRFVPHQRLELPIELSQACADVPCDERTTCARGRCVPAAVDEPGFCVGDACGPPAKGDAGDAAVVVAPTRVLSRPQVYGFAATPSRLYWSEDAGVFYVAWAELDSAAPTVTSLPLFEVFKEPRGLAAVPLDADFAIFVVGSGCPVARREFTADYFATNAANCPTVQTLGVAGYPTRSSEGGAPYPHAAITLPSLSEVRPRVNSPAVAVDQPGYAEATAAEIFVAAQGGLRSFALDPDGRTAPIADAGALPGQSLLGIAVGTKRIYLSTRSGGLLAVDRATRAVVPVPAAPPSLTGIQDLLFVSTPTGGDLYIAASDGVYRARNVE